MYDPLRVEVPQLVPRDGTLFRPNDDPSTGAWISSADVEDLVVHFADDEEVPSATISSTTHKEIQDDVRYGILKCVRVSVPTNSCVLVNMLKSRPM